MAHSSLWDQKTGAKESRELQVPVLKRREFSNAVSTQTWRDGEPWTGREIPYGAEGLSWPMVGFPAWGIFPSAGQHAGHNATGSFSGSGSGVGLFLKLS